MRLFMLSVLVLTYPAGLAAQSCESAAALAGTLVPGRVAVRTKAGDGLEGTLVCLDPDVVVLRNGVTVHKVPLRDVATIVKPADPLWNGMAIGAALGLLAVAGHADVGAIPAYALLGAGIDALRGSGWTIYSANATAGGRDSKVGFAGGRSAAVAFRVRF